MVGERGWGLVVSESVRGRVGGEVRGGREGEKEREEGKTGGWEKSRGGSRGERGSYLQREENREPAHHARALRLHR